MDAAYGGGHGMASWLGLAWDVGEAGTDKDRANSVLRATPFWGPGGAAGRRLAGGAPRPGRTAVQDATSGGAFGGRPPPHPRGGALPGRRLYHAQPPAPPPKRLAPARKVARLLCGRELGPESRLFLPHHQAGGDH